MKNSFLLVLLFSATSCTTIGNWADSAGSNMPNIGEPCYHWQCFTSEGRAKSDLIKAQMQKAEQKPQYEQPSPQQQQPELPKQ